MNPADLTDRDLAELEAKQEETQRQRDRIRKQYYDWKRTEAFQLYIDMTKTDEARAIEAMISANDPAEIARHQQTIRCSRVFRHHYVPMMEAMLTEAELPTAPTDNGL